jgi:DNA invertase Pin-like site-specific DNA recombinase
MINLLGSIAQFERELMLERQREGIAKAKAEGKYKGRAPTARRQTEEIARLKSQGHRADEIAQTLGISRASVFRVLKTVSL